MKKSVKTIDGTSGMIYNYCKRQNRNLEACKLKKIRFGIIGCGWMGKEFASAAGRWCHLSGEISKPEITAVCYRSEKSVQWFEDNVDTLIFKTQDYKELLARDDIDAIYCALPHNLHGDVYVDIINSGKHLLGEKPFGMDALANEKIMEAVKKHPEVIVRCASEFPYYPAAQKLVDYVKSGKTGRIIEVHAGINHSSDMDLNKPINWKRMVNINGEYGCMGDLGIHTQHIPFRLGWKPQEVFATLSNIATERFDANGVKVPCETWDNATLVCTMKEENGNSFPAFFEMKRMKPAETNEWYIRVDGLKSSVRFSTNDPNAFYFTFSEGREQGWCRIDVGYSSVVPTITSNIFEFGFTDAMLQMWASFIQEIDGNNPEFGCFTPEETVLSHKMLTAALRSHKERRLVEIEY